jgi:hypothetical protein
VAVRAEFAAQARTADLAAGQASALQGKVDAYLTKVGAKATQADYNTIALEGADLHVTVPGEAHPRGLAASYCSFKYFCAYSGAWQTRRRDPHVRLGRGQLDPVVHHGLVGE